MINKRNFKACVLTALAFTPMIMTAQEKISITLHPDQGKNIISRHIYGQFAEHLGTCIYGGLWVGENSSIPNTQGYRNDVLEALKALSIPNLRWPGGCFADEYHWMDGIGPREQRPRMVNNNWGGTVEDNSFGTHEFLNLCELLNCEPYVSGNVGSGSVEEMAKWIEYMTAQDGPMAKLRKQNGREKPWKVHFFGVGNECWGCGGSMRPEYYADIYRRYSTYCRNYNGNELFKIASGASDYDYNWTEVLMKNVGTRMNGLSLHYYTAMDWNKKGSATQFTEDDYYGSNNQYPLVNPVEGRAIDGFLVALSTLPLDDAAIQDLFDSLNIDKAETDSLYAEFAAKDYSDFPTSLFGRDDAVLSIVKLMVGDTLPDDFDPATMPYSFRS